MVVLALGLLAAAARAADPCLAPANRIVAENCMPGSPSTEWSSSGDSGVQGFSDDISYSTGQSVVFRVKASAGYSIEIYRMGYYGGLGARRVALLAGLPAQAQPSCAFDSTTRLVDCGNWAPSATWLVPPETASGIYFARFVRLDAGGSSHAAFIVRDDSGSSDLLVQTADTTWQAYNDYGGFSLYRGSPSRAFKVSYNRPTDTSELFEHEYPLVRWLESNGYDVSYFAGVDTDRRGALLLRHRAFVSVGHDEYWSGGQRANVEAARAAGIHLAFLSGDAVDWKTRWEPSIDGSTTAFRTLACYKETYSNRKVDPSPTWTGMWRDGRVVAPPEGGRPENALMGTLFAVDARRDDPLVVDAASGRLRFWRNTAAAALAPGQTASFAEILGYEWDESPDDPARPAGLIQLSSVTYLVQGRQQPDFSLAPGTATHHLTLYRHPSGSLVFGAGTMQWSWGLDPNHPTPSGHSAHAAIQQATVNLLADMGAQPANLQPGLVAAAASSDAAPPVSAFQSPPSGSSVPAGAVVQVTGTAADADGAVGGVEVSTDGGATWRQAAGTDRWSYSWIAQKAGTATVLSRAVDDSGNIETPGPGIAVLVSSAPGQPPPSPNLLLEPFSQPDGLITNEFATYNPTNPSSVRSSTWEVTSGSLFVSSGQGWTGVPDNVPPNATSSYGTDSSVFRAITRRSDFADAALSFSLRTVRLVATSSTPSSGSDGVYALLRYQNFQTFYIAWVNRRDGTVVLKKKLNGAYSTLTSAAYAYPPDTAQLVRFAVKNQVDGSVRLELSIDGRTLLSSTDASGPIAAAGRVGIWGTNAEFRFDDFSVDSLAAPPPPPPPPPSTTAYLLLDSFAQADGLITNEFATYNPTNPSSIRSSTWEMTTGSLFASGGEGWTGAPDDVSPNAASSNGTGSAVFHAITKRADFGDVGISFSLKTLRLLTTGSTPALGSDGVSVVLRYQGGQTFYIVWVNRRDNTAVAKKKLYGTYTTLGSVPLALALNTAQNVRVSAANQPDGSVRLELSIDGRVALSARDPGTGAAGAAIRTAGRAGLWSTNTEFKFDDFGVSPLDSSGTAGLPEPPTLAAGEAPTVGPNPWRADHHAGQPVVFRRLPSGATVRLFTLSGREVRALREAGGNAAWDLSSGAGERAAAGFYLFTVEAPGRSRGRGVLAIIR